MVLALHRHFQQFFSYMYIVTSEARTAYTSDNLNSLLVFTGVHVAKSLVFCVVLFVDHCIVCPSLIYLTYLNRSAQQISHFDQLVHVEYCKYIP